MEKKLLCYLLTSLMLCTALVGCTSEGQQENTTTTSSTTTTVSETTDSEKAKTVQETTVPNETSVSMKKVTLNEVAHSIFYAPQYVAIEKGYFAEEGIDLDLVCGFGADKTMTAVLSGDADIGFMGAEASIYAYQEGANDPVVNFAQLTQRAGNFLVAREEMPDFTWNDLKGKSILGGRKGVVHYIM